MPAPPDRPDSPAPQTPAPGPPPESPATESPLFCPFCGYDNHDQAGPWYRCPECGRRFHQREADPSGNLGRMRRLDRTLTPSLLALAAFFALALAGIEAGTRGTTGLLAIALLFALLCLLLLVYSAATRDRE